MTPTASRPVTSLSSSFLFENDGIFSLQLVTGKGSRTTSKWYRLTRIESDFGTAFRLTPTMGDVLASGTEYEMILDGAETTCTCPGHSYTGGCKHASALLEFRDAGRI